ncbi:MAG TPA: GGDEF domain-containing protein [Gammaproteobacteria bacterium]|nr:GGDEF domain-containing protein [Gammaproteobacteria bacterium]
MKGGFSVLDPDPHAALSRRVEALLGPLDRLPEGSVLRRRLSVLLSAFEATSRQMEDAYCSGLRKALHRLADAQPADASRIRAIAETVRPPLSAGELEVLLDEALAASGEDGVDERDDASSPEASPGGIQESAAPESERQFAAIYRHQLESRSRDIEALQANLYRDAEESIRHNREAGELLDSLITRLQLSSDLPEVMESREQLSDDLSRIANAHQAISAKLEDTLRSLHSISADHDRLHNELKRVRTLSLTDEGTGLPNRRAFMRQLSAEISRVSRDGGGFCLALVDLDRFKVINDRHGHGAGDAVLVCYARSILSVFRTQDLVARYGGEEFVVLLPSTSEAGGVRALAKAQAAARDASIEWQDERLTVPTFSAGVAEFRRGDTADTVIQRADRALYEAKRAGRNLIQAAGDASPPPSTGPSPNLVPHVAGSRSEP